MLDVKTLGYAMREGHFEIEPRFHASKALLCSSIFRDYMVLEHAARDILEHFGVPSRLRPDVLAGATACGATMASFAAAYLASVGIEDAKLIRRPDSTLSAEYAHSIRGAACLVLAEHALERDAIAGLSRAIQEGGGAVMGVGLLCDRRDVKAKVEGLETYAAFDLSGLGVNVDLDQGDCPLCGRGVPLTVNVRVI